MSMVSGPQPAAHNFFRGEGVGRGGGGDGGWLVGKIIKKIFGGGGACLTNPFPVPCNAAAR